MSKLFGFRIRPTMIRNVATAPLMDCAVRLKRPLQETKREPIWRPPCPWIWVLTCAVTSPTKGKCLQFGWCRDICQNRRTLPLQPKGGRSCFSQELDKNHPTSTRKIITSLVDDDCILVRGSANPGDTRAQSSEVAKRAEKVRISIFFWGGDCDVEGARQMKDRSAYSVCTRH